MGIQGLNTFITFCYINILFTTKIVSSSGLRVLKLSKVMNCCHKFTVNNCCFNIQPHLIVSAETKDVLYLINRVSQWEKDLLAFTLVEATRKSGHKPKGTSSSNCTTPRQPTIHLHISFLMCATPRQPTIH